MKYLAATLLLFLCGSCLAQRAETQAPYASGAGKSSATAKKMPTVLVELFTSEGCSSCPPAERNLAYLQAEQPIEGTEVVTLAFHVDYWDGLGWKDKFASPLFTQRQRVYDRKFRTGNIYTPQMVVDGDDEFVGSKIEKVEIAVRKAAKTEKAVIALDFADGMMDISVIDIPDIGDATVYLAFAEDGLSSEISRGENAGKNLKHVSVVRSLNGLGRVLPGERDFRHRFTLSVPKEWKVMNLKAIVFLQENSTRKIYGVASAPLPLVQR